MPDHGIFRPISVIREFAIVVFLGQFVARKKTERVKRMHSKYSGRTTIVTLAGLAALGWAGVALTVRVVMNVL